jgi:hypothetical protein
MDIVQKLSNQFCSLMIFHKNLLTSVNGSPIQYTEHEIMGCIYTKQIMEHVIHMALQDWGQITVCVQVK